MGIGGVQCSGWQISRFLYRSKVSVALRWLTAGLIRCADASVYTSGLAPAKNLQLVTP